MIDTAPAHAPVRGMAAEAIEPAHRGTRKRAHFESDQFRQACRAHDGRRRLHAVAETAQHLIALLENKAGRLNEHVERGLWAKCLVELC